MRAVSEFCARAIDAAGDADFLVFVERAAVEDDDFFAALDFALDVGRVHARCCVMMFDVFAERLARHVDAAVDLIARGRPGFDAARQYRDVGVAVAQQHVGGALREAVAAVQYDYTRVAARHQ